MELLQIALDWTNVGIGIGSLVGIGTLGITLNKNLNKRFDKKADDEPTNRRFEELHKEISYKADLSAFKEFDKKLDVIIKLSKNNH